LVPAAACCTLRAISRVAEPCSSTAAAMVGGGAADLPDVSLIAADRGHTIAGGGLNCGDLAGDLLGGLAVWLASSLNLGGDHRKSPAGLAGTRRSMVAIKRQQIGLARDGADQRSTSPIFSAALARPPTFRCLAGLDTALSATRWNG